jgi:hypothetical protein
MPMHGPQRGVAWKWQDADQPCTRSDAAHGQDCRTANSKTSAFTVPCQKLEEDTVMPRAWSDKDERQYEHVKRSERERGRTADRAKEIAARTVNKQRRSSGETPNRTTQGTGNPNTPLEDRSKRELYNRAAQLHIAGRSNMDKATLIEAIRRHG